MLSDEHIKGVLDEGATRQGQFPFVLIELKDYDPDGISIVDGFFVLPGLVFQPVDLFTGKEALYPVLLPNNQSGTGGRMLEDGDINDVANTQVSFGPSIG